MGVLVKATSILPVASVPVLLLIAVMGVSSGKPHKVAMVAVLGFLPLCMVALKHRKPGMSWLALALYGFIGFQYTVWAMGRMHLHLVFGSILLFLPVLLFEYLYRVRDRSIPHLGAMTMMVASLLVSNVYQMVAYHGVVRYPFEYDGFFLASIAFFFVVYMLLRLQVLTLRDTLTALACAGVPVLLLVLLRYAEIGKLGGILGERLGTSVEIGPNFISSVLDICFPLALGLAIHEKRKPLKTGLSLIAALYALCLLATSSRGSMIGCVAVVIYLAWRSGSIKRMAAIFLVAAALGSVFGAKMVARLVTPDRHDMYSNIGRVEMLRSGFKVLKDNYFLFGIGMDNFRKEKFSYGFPSWFDTISGMSSHNTHLEIWLGWGLPALVGWLYIWISGIIYTARLRPHSEYHYLRAPLILVSIAFFSHGFFDSMVALFPFLLLVFCFLACLAFAVSQGNGIPRPQSPHHPAGVPLSL